MIQAVPRYDELYVVSDIHMGGRPGFQILNQGLRLGRLIEKIAKRRPEDTVALVMNGDIIDSLAEDVQGYVAIEDAESMMRHIYTDDAFAPVWKGLAQFVHEPRRHLVFVLGNHDIELALPHVERSIRQEIAGDDPNAQGRILFETHGTGHACLVGHSRVFCTHGNEVDDWNVVDYDALGRLGRSINAGSPLARSEWRPNAGTRMVVDVMNAIKQDFPFVDLLKPETTAVVPILLALDPGRVRDVLPNVPRLVADKIRGSLKKVGLLGESQDIEVVQHDPAAAEAAIVNLLGPHFAQAVGASQAISEKSLLLEVEEHHASGDSPETLAVDSAEVETLGGVQYIIDRVRGLGKVESLRRALQDWLSGDDTFALTTKDSTYQEVMQQVGTVDFVVTGHTHLERAISSSGNQPAYYNCGTWIRLLRLSGTVLSDAETFQKVYAALESGRMEALDDTVVGSEDQGTEEPLVLIRSSVVRVSSEDGKVVGALLHVEDDGQDVSLNPVPQSEFERR